MMEEDRRKYVRVHLPLEVRWHGISGRSTARTGDISIGGCYVDSIAHMRVGERVSLEIKLPTGGWLSLSGEVVNHHPHAGFGVYFTGLTESAREMLARLIESAGKSEAGTIEA